MLIAETYTGEIAAIDCWVIVVPSPYLNSSVSMGFRCLLENQIWKLLLKHYIFFQLTCFAFHLKMVKICRSPLLRLYLSEMETQFKGKFSVIRFCICIFFSPQCNVFPYMWYLWNNTYVSILAISCILLCRCCNCTQDMEELKDCEYTQINNTSFLFSSSFIHTEKFGHPL